MKKRLLKVAVTSALTVAFAVPAFANPFNDVPANHWAYDAVNELAQAGVVQGYGDGSFNGDKTMTRYEMAQVVAGVMRLELSDEQKANVDKLAREFANELDSLGVEVAAVKEEQERVKVSGDARLRYGATDENGDDTDYRARVTVDGKINDNLRFSSRLASGNIEYNKSDNKNGNGIYLDTANVSFNALGLDNTIGRQDLYLGNGTLIDDKINGISTELGGLKVYYGNQTGENERLYGAELSTNLFGGSMNFDYMRADAYDAGKEDKEFYGVSAAVPVGGAVTVNAEYMKENNSGDDAVAYGVKLNKLGLSAMYKDVEKGAYTAYSSAASDINDISFMSDGYKGMEYRWDKDIAENTRLTLKYQDFKSQNGAEKDDRAAAYLNVKF